jgi:hypothetical protein
MCCVCKVVPRSGILSKPDSLKMIRMPPIRAVHCSIGVHHTHGTVARHAAEPL